MKVYAASCCDSFALAVEEMKVDAELYGSFIYKRPTDQADFKPMSLDLISRPLFPAKITRKLTPISYFCH